MFNLWQMGLDVQEVMTTRILLMLAGKLTQQEAHRMVAEKHSAYSRAQSAGAVALFSGRPLQGIEEMVEIYRGSVSANCSRLSTRR